MGDDRRASFFSLYLAPTYTIAVGRSDSISVGSGDYGSKSGSYSVRGDNGFLWYQGSQTRFQATTQKASEEEGGIWDSILEWFGNQFDSFLDSITKIFTKEFWDLKTSISDSLTNATNGFWNKLTGSLDTQKGVLIKIQTEIELQTIKLNDMIFFFTNNYNDSGLLFNLKSIVSTGNLISKNLSDIKLFMTNDFNSNGMLWHLKRINSYGNEVLSWLSKIESFLTNGSNPSGLMWYIRKYDKYLESIILQIGSESLSTGLNYQIRQVLSYVIGIYTAVKEIPILIGGDNTNIGVNYQIRQVLAYAIGIFHNTKNLSDLIGGDLGKTGLNYQIRQVLSYMTGVYDNTKNLSLLIGGELGKTGLNYQLREIISTVNGIKPFTLEELEKMLKKVLKEIDYKINIGDTVNEAGKNMWDVLDSLTEGIFDLGKEIVKANAEVIKAIAELVRDIMKELLKLIVPDNTDFIDNVFDDLSGKFNKKFEVIFKLSGDIKTLFTPIETNAFDSMSFEYLGAKADMNQAKRSLDTYASKFRVLMQIIIWILCVIGCYRKVTGKGDLINDS